MSVSTFTPIDSSKSMPTRRSTSISGWWVLRPAPRPVRSSGLRSKTVTSQPTERSRCAANSPPSEPPITRARRWAMRSGDACARSGHCPGHGVVAGAIVAVALRRVAVEQRAAVERTGLAAHPVVDGEQPLAGVDVDHVLEAIFVVVDLGGDEAELLEPPIGAGEIGDVDLRVVAVVWPLRRVGFGEVPVLL